MKWLSQSIQEMASEILVEKNHHMDSGWIQSRVANIFLTSLAGFVKSQNPFTWSREKKLEMGLKKELMLQNKKVAKCNEI